MRSFRFIVFLLSVVLVSLPAFAANFDPVFHKTILPHEGGYTCARNDPGNWTGGKVGKGRCLGTKYGIAANTYGAELLRQGKTIKGLTVEDAARFYKRDFWDSKYLYVLKSQGIADELCDEVVNMGEGGGRALLVKLAREYEWASGHPTPVRPGFTREFMEWINAYTATRPNRIAFYNSIRMKRVAFYDALVKKKPKMRPFFLSWIDRSVD